MGPRPAKRVTRLPKDSDGDGLTDAEERTIGSSIHSRDSDGDGIDDKDEFFLGSDPNRQDTDRDGLSDRAEQLLGTNATEADTDGDGISDGVEIAHGSSPRSTVPPDDPFVLDQEKQAMREKQSGRDSDHDGLADDWERKFGTNPYLDDSDGDGLGDRIEVLRGTDPTNNDSDFDQDWNDLGDVLRGRPVEDMDRVLPGDYLNADARDVLGSDEDDVAGFISHDEATRLATMSREDMGTNVVPPSVRAALGWDEEPGETIEVAPPPEDVEILDHGIDEPDFPDAGGGLTMVAAAELPADAAVLDPVDDLATTTSFDETSVTTDDPIA